MSDHDRGAYTPQTDEPLAFDARRPSERRPIPMTLIGSAVVLVLLIGGVALVYRGGARGKDEAPRPVGQPVMSVKTAPGLTAETTTNTTTSSSQTDISTASKPEPVTLGANQIGDAPTFAAAPEQPAARPKPSPSTIAMMAPKPAAPPVTPPTHTVTRSTTTESTKLDPSLVEAAGMTRASDATGTIKLAQIGKPRHVTPNAISEEDDAVATPTKAAKPAAAKPVVAKAVPSEPVEKTASAGATSSSVVQIGAFSSTALADTGYADVSKTLSGRMSGKSKHVLPVTTANGKTLFRTWVSGFSTRADANAFCEALKAKNKTCIVKG